MISRDAPGAGRFTQCARDRRGARGGEGASFCRPPSRIISCGSSPRRVARMLRRSSRRRSSIRRRRAARSRLPLAAKARAYLAGRDSCAAGRRRRARRRRALAPHDPHLARARRRRCGARRRRPISTSSNRHERARRERSRRRSRRRGLMRLRLASHVERDGASRLAARPERPASAARARRRNL